MWRHLFIIIILSASGLSINAQWDFYEATWEGKPGSVVVNMDWKKYAPIQDLPYLLEVVMELAFCEESGFGNATELQLTDRFSNRIDSVLSLTNYLESVGTMSHNCQIRDFYYINDTVGVSNKIKLVSNDMSYTTRLIKDADWKGYLYFLYPDAYLQQTMVNAKIVKELIKAGDDVNKTRRIMHYAGFTSAGDREKYRTFILENGFRIEEEKYDLKSLAPYQFNFSRRDKPATDWISEVTLKLSRKAAALNGAYDGWEVEITE